MDQASGAIYTPFLDILYAERSITGTVSASDTGIYASPTVNKPNTILIFVSFQSDYSQSVCIPNLLLYVAG